MASGFLQSVFDASIPGERINAAREQRSQRQAKNEQRERDAAAFKAIQEGDVLGAAGQNPDIAAKFQDVQQGQTEFGQEQEQLGDDRFRETGLRAVNALESMVSNGADVETAFDKIVASSGSLFGNEEELAQIREAVVGGGPEGIKALKAALDPASANNKGRFISTKGGIFDTQTQKIIAGQDPNAGLERELLQSKIGANDALAAQREAKADAPPALTKGQEALDKAFATDFAEFQTTGAPVALANLARLDDAVTQLTENSDLAGPLAGFGPVELRQITNPASAAVQQQVQNAVQASLKATLGAQFARVEGEQLLDRAFSPRQQENENIRRVQIVSATIKDMVERQQAMGDFFIKTGSLQGYDGPRPNVQTFLDILQQFKEGDEAVEAAIKSGLAPEKASRLQELRAKRDEGSLDQAAPAEGLRP